MDELAVLKPKLTRLKLYTKQLVARSMSATRLQTTRVIFYSPQDVASLTPDEFKRAAANLLFARPSRDADDHPPGARRRSDLRAGMPFAFRFNIVHS